MNAHLPNRHMALGWILPAATALAALTVATMAMAQPPAGGQGYRQGPPPGAGQYRQDGPVQPRRQGPPPHEYRDQAGPKAEAGDLCPTCGRGPRPEGAQGQGFHHRGPRPDGGQGQGFHHRGPRPGGQGGYDRQGPPPQGFQGEPRGDFQRPAGPPPHMRNQSGDGYGPRRDGQGPRQGRGFVGHPDDFDRQGPPRGEGGPGAEFRPRGPRPDGDEGFRPRGPRPEGANDFRPGPPPVIDNEAPGAVPPPPPAEDLPPPPAPDQAPAL